MRCLFFLVVLTVSTLSAFGQDEEELIFGSTEKTSKDPNYDSKTRNKHRKDLLLIRTDSKRVLDGNKCFKDYQQSIGVRVAKLEKGEPGNYNDLSRWFHNIGVRVKGTFRNGPFWVIRLNKRMKECREQLHDFIG